MISFSIVCRVLLLVLPSTLSVTVSHSSSPLPSPTHFSIHPIQCRELYCAISTSSNHQPPIIMLCPRPISHAPITSCFTPAAPPHRGNTNTSRDTPVRAGAMNASSNASGGGGGNNGGMLSGAARFLHMANRHDPTAGLGFGSAAAAAGYSPNHSPLAGPMQAGVNISSLSLSSPSPPLVPSFPASPRTNALSAHTLPPHVDLYTPPSPMIDSLHGGPVQRRDSVDEAEVASQHLQSILWRNAQSQLKQAQSIRHVHVPHIGLGLPANAASGGRSILMSPSATATATPATPAPHTPAPGSATPNTPPAHTLTRAIPIAKPRMAGSTVLSQMQQQTDELGTSQGNRRSSMAGAPSSSFVGSPSPMPSSLSSSYILSHTPPVRAANPLEFDGAFSPTTQATRFRELQQLMLGQASASGSPSATSFASPASPHMSPGAFGLFSTNTGYGQTALPPASFSSSTGSNARPPQSPVLPSSLSLSLAMRQQSPVAPATNANATSTRP